MPGLRRLRDPRRGAELHAGARHPAREDRLRLRHRLRRRFPYYMNTYGMHSIHGRAPAIATGLATSRPDLSVWVVTGDGDMLSIGGNHLIHALRRNVNLKILLFNNQIYGLTKGQYSPTSRARQGDEVDADGLDRRAVQPARRGDRRGGDVRRARDRHRPASTCTEVLARAAAHRGAAFVEILQNCNIFNDGAFDAVREDEANRISSATASRCASARRASAASSRARRLGARSWTSRRSARTRCSSTTSTTRSRASRSRSRG